MAFPWRVSMDLTINPVARIYIYIYIPYLYPLHLHSILLLPPLSFSPSLPSAPHIFPSLNPARSGERCKLPQTLVAPTNDFWQIFTLNMKHLTMTQTSLVLLETDNQLAPDVASKSLALT